MKINRKPTGMVLLGVLCAFILTSAFSCNNNHAAVVIEHDFQLSVTAAQTIEINEFQAGNIDAATHQKIQGIFLKVAQGGEQVATLMLQNAAKPTIATALTGVLNSLQELLDAGTLGIKNPTTLTDFKDAVLAAKAIVANLQTFVQ